MKIAFTDNYEDLSSDRGYQFKFLCQRCGNGYMSSFKKSTTGTISGAVRILGNFFEGGDRIASSTDEAQRMTAGKTHDKPLRRQLRKFDLRSLNALDVRNGFVKKNVGTMRKGCAKAARLILVWKWQQRRRQEPLKKSMPMLKLLQKICRARLIGKGNE